MTRIFFTIGTLITSVVIYYTALWIFLFYDNTGTREELIELFLSYYPKLVRGPILATIFEIILCLISIVCFFLCVLSVMMPGKKEAAWVTYGSLALLILNMLFIAWLLFTLL
ncbi:MAG: hypothetical protein CRN43_07585 [Candidatus Nephrothrix sp. EaCA]|nr:MAG: hypothetical protein CRN43_07585 [Candidatus Nephrothrix sp. EaCA]